MNKVDVVIKVCTPRYININYVTLCIKQSKSHNSYKFCRIKIVPKKAQVRVMTNNPTKHVYILSYGFRTVVFTKCDRRSRGGQYTKYQNLDMVYQICQVQMTQIDWFLLCLMPLSAIFQLYHGDQFQWWKKPEYPERTTYHGQATGKLCHLRLRVECTPFCNLQSRA